jgi:hypothetical protein
VLFSYGVSGRPVGPFRRVHESKTSVRNYHYLLPNSCGVHILLRPHQTESTHPHSTGALNAGASPTPDFSYSKRSSEPARHSTHVHTFHANAPCPDKHNIGHTWTTPRKSRQEYGNNPSKPYFLQNLPSQETRLHRTSPKLQHRTKHTSPRTSRPQTQNHPPDSNMSLTVDCNNEISLLII